MNAFREIPAGKYSLDVEIVKLRFSLQQCFLTGEPTNNYVPHEVFKT